MCLDYKSDKGCKYGDKCRFRHVEVDVQPSKKSKKSGVTGSVAFFLESIQLGFVSHDFHLRRSIPRKEGKSGLNHTVGHVAPHHNSGQKGPSRGVVQKSVNFMSAIRADPSLRRGHETKLCTKNDAPAERRETWRIMSVSSEKLIKRRFTIPFEARAMRAPTDSGASMHMLCKKELSWDELETSRRFRNSTTVLTASGEVQSKCVRSRSWSLRNRVVAWIHVCSSVNSAQNTVNNRGWQNKGTNYAKRKTSYLLLSWIAVKLWYEFILAITGLIKYIFKSSNSEVTNPHQETGASHQKPKTEMKNKEGYQSSLGRPFARPARMVWGVQR